MNNQIRVFSLATFTLYSIVNGIIYQFSFWDNFDINIMQFISINDLLPSIAFSVLLPIALLGLYAFVMSFLVNTKAFRSMIMLMMGVKEGSSSNIIISIPEKTGKYKPIINLKRALIFPLLGASSIILLSAFIAFQDTSFGIKNFIIVTLCISIGALLLTNEEIKRNLGKAFLAVVVIIAMTPYIMFLSGTTNAKKIIRGEDSFIVKSESICNKNNKNQKFRYIANISDKAFTYSLIDRSICIFKYDSLMLIKEESLSKNS